MGPLKNADAKYFKGEIAFWNEVMKHGTYDDFWKARNLRPHVKNIKPAVLTVGGWFDAENLFGALEIYKHAEASTPPKSQSSRDGTVGPRRLEPRRRRHARRRSLQREDRRLLPREDRVPVLRVPPEGRRRRRAPEGVGVRDRHERVAQARRLAAEGRESREVPPAQRREAVRASRLQSTGRFGHPATGVRRVRQRPREAGAVHRQDRHQHGEGVHDRRPAVRVHAARRARLSDDAC